MPKKVIGIDINSTITSTGKKTSEYLKKYAPEYSNYKLLPKENYDEFLNLYEELIHTNCELKDGVQEAFAFLKSQNYKIVIITARNKRHCKKQKKITKEYFKNHNLKYDKIIFNQEYKGWAVSRNKCQIFIDDCESNLNDISKYNIECLKFGQKSDNYPSFKNWYEIIEYLKKQSRRL